MAELAVKNLDNKNVRSLELSDAVFGYPAKPYLVHEAVCHYLAKGRAGTHATKTRKEVAGGGRKPWRRRRPVAPGTGRSGRRSGEAAARYTVRGHATIR